MSRAIVAVLRTTPATVRRDYHELVNLARYEEVLERPEESLRGICDFLGVEFDPRMLAFHEDTSYAPPDPALAYQWKRKLSETDLRLVEARIGPMLTERGYELSGLPPLRPSFLRRLWLRTQNRLYRASYRRKRYGLRLWLTAVLAERLGLRGLERRTQLKLNEIDRKHLK